MIVDRSQIVDVELEFMMNLNEFEFRVKVYD